ncbi:hypothetical protein [Mucilaginibacter sp. L3T2-6]|uniref:hypothetical protein n=1 Tax=Mucilaginibacter sp. L3T2-6 TaxID=3062491 RepID=UPI0026763D86|nr:hypothetical protein [Mucilaginibacter sp. L3T2-6]MDO3643488.1 hypothetical protein [Mucilaginibacter sp. L3T2-6]MDV6215939.1 hypothetical protein [Mucilaginibacter sp. L3T2-6]
MNSTLMPTKPGQICKIVSGIADMEPEEVYILTEDPSKFENDDDILVVNLKDLQRNIKNPANAERIPVRKEELVVVGDDLTSYVHSWNNK